MGRRFRGEKLHRKDPQKTLEKQKITNQNIKPGLWGANPQRSEDELIDILNL